MNINTWLSVWIRRYRKAQNSRVLDQNEKTERKIKNIIIQLHQVEYKHRGNWEQISCDFVRLFGRSVILYCIKTCLSSRLRVLCYKIFDHALNCATWEVWRAPRKLKLTLKLLPCSPNFPRASVCRLAKHGSCQFVYH